MVLERWDKSAKVTYDRRVMNDLVSLRFVEDHRNAVVLGPVGVGKTFVNATGPRPPRSRRGRGCERSGHDLQIERLDRRDTPEVLSVLREDFQSAGPRGHRDENVVR